MKLLLKITLFFCIAISSAQTKLELTPQGFPSIEMQTPNKSLHQLLEDSKSWAAYYNQKGYDIFDMTENSISIEALNENAYYYWNLGVKYNYDIKYILKIVFEENQKYRLTFKVKEILTDHVLTKTTVSDFFTSDGNVKGEFKEAKESLESTANKIVNSYVAYISQ